MYYSLLIIKRKTQKKMSGNKIFLAFIICQLLRLRLIHLRLLRLRLIHLRLLRLRLNHLSCSSSSLLQHRLPLLQPKLVVLPVMLLPQERNFAFVYFYS
jgi:hypothetical protein